MNMASSGYCETKFNGRNFFLWKKQLFDLFRLNDICPASLGLGTEVCCCSDTVLCSTMTPYTRKALNWKKKDSEACLLLMSTVEEKWQHQLADLTNAALMWTRIKEWHAEYVSLEKYTIMQNFFDYHYQQGFTMEQHIGHIQQLVDQLSDIGHPISEFQIIAKLLGTLPAGYRNFISVWDSVPEEDQRLSLLILRLCKEQDLNANKLDTSGSDWTIPSSLPTWSSTSSVSSSYQSASTRKERKRNRTSSKDRCTCCDKHTSTCQNKERVRCLFCGRYGHQQADCNWHNTNLETEKDVVVVEEVLEPQNNQAVIDIT